MSYDYEFRKVPRMGMKEELIAWKASQIAVQDHPEGTTCGDVVRMILEEVHEICEGGRLRFELDTYYADWDEITENNLDM